MSFSFCLLFCPIPAKTRRWHIHGGYLCATDYSFYQCCHNPNIICLSPGQKPFNKLPCVRYHRVKLRTYPVQLFPFVCCSFLSIHPLVFIVGLSIITALMAIPSSS